MPDTEFYKAQFLEFDTSGDGCLTYDEFRQHIIKMLKNPELSDAATRNMYDDVNRASDDYITVDEWVNFLDRVSLKDVGKQELTVVFNELDQSGDGKLGKDEIRAALQASGISVPDDEFEGVFQMADTSGDGYVSISEFSDAFYKELD